MKRTADFITRHKSLLMLALMLTTLVAGSIANQRRLENESSLTTLPVMETEPAAATSVETYLDDRDSAYQREINALTALIEQEQLDDRTRESAADQLQELIAAHTASAALEEALADSDLAPCAAVISGGSLTLVTAKSSVSDEDSALVLTLARAHAGIEPENVHIRTAE